MADGSLRIEDISKRTMYTKTFKMNNQKYEVDHYSYPIHYFDNEKEIWNEINLEVKDITNWEFSNSSTDNGFNIYFGDNSDEVNNHLFGIEYKSNNEDKWINFKLKGSGCKEKEVYGEFNEKIKFVECFKNIDLEYIVEPNSLKENVIINKYTQRRKFDFTIKSGGTNIIEFEEGLRVVDSMSNEIIWDIEKPYMIDSKNNVSYGVKYIVEDELFSIIIEDEEFMNNSTYPIILDPTVNINSNTDNVRLRTIGESRPASWTYNTDTSMGVKYFDYGMALSALYFNELDTYRADNIQVNKAILSIYSTSGGSNFGVANLTSNLTSSVNPTSDEVIYFSSVVTANKWIDIDFTAQINNRKGSFFGFYLMPTGKSNNNGIYFHSPFSTSTTLRPKLTIEYLIRPTLGFHDGDPTVGGYYSDNLGNVFRYIDFGTIIAGTTSTPKQLFLRNLSNFTVSNVNVKVETVPLAQGVYLELSLSRNPFNPVTEFVFGNSISADQDISFYARIRADDIANSGGENRLLANAYPA